MKNDARILKLTNDLIKELIKQGYDIRAQGEDGTIPGYLTIDINIHRCWTDNVMSLRTSVAGWEIKGKCTAKYPRRYLDE